MQDHGDFSEEIGKTTSRAIDMCDDVCVYIYIYICVWEDVKMYVSLYIYIYMCV